MIIKLKWYIYKEARVGLRKWNQRRPTPTFYIKISVQFQLRSQNFLEKNWLFLMECASSWGLVFLKKTTVPFSATFLFTFKQFYWIKTFGVRATIAQDSSAPSILPPWVWLPSTLSTLLSLNVKFVLYLSLRCEKITKINKKRPGLAHLKKDFSRFQTRIVRVEGLLTATTTASFCYFPDTH